MYWAIHFDNASYGGRIRKVVMETGNKLSRQTYGRARFNRAVMCVVLLLFSFQLLGTSLHKHSYLDAQPDCASCVFVHTLPSDLPPVTAPAVTMLASLSYWIVGFSVHVFLAQPSYLTPPSHAPPDRILPL